MSRFQTSAVAEVWRALRTDGLPDEPEAHEEAVVRRWCDALAREEISLFTRAGRRAFRVLFRVNPELAALILDELLDELCDA